MGDRLNKYQKVGNHVAVVQFSWNRGCREDRTRSESGEWLDSAMDTHIYTCSVTLESTLLTITPGAGRSLAGHKNAASSWPQWLVQVSICDPSLANKSFLQDFWLKPIRKVAVCASENVGSKDCGSLELPRASPLCQPTEIIHFLLNYNWHTIVSYVQNNDSIFLYITKWSPRLVYLPSVTVENY